MTCANTSRRRGLSRSPICGEITARRSHPSAIAFFAPRLLRYRSAPVRPHIDDLLQLIADFIMAFQHVRKHGLADDIAKRGLRGPIDALT